MQTYLVGGAVRDALLGLPVSDRDWVVVGATPQQMLDAGFKQVGADFPVFLHPQTKEEYALARTERKSAQGYHGFTVYAAPDVTLEADLTRRDLTINAMAQTQAGEIIDPYGGQADLQQGLLRHVSPAFAEDPLRILRVARFAARYAPLGFRIAPETLALMQQMVVNGEADALVPERIWQETQRALHEKAPRVYFECLRACSALKVILPELDALFGVPQTALHHPEVDTGEHVLQTLERACELSEETSVRVAALLHDLGKGATPQHEWPRHIAHEKRGLALVDQVCKRLKLPKDCQQLARLTCEYHTHVHRAFDLRSHTLLKLFNALDLWRRPQRFAQLLLACEADARGRTGFADKPYPQADYLRRAAACALEVSIQTFLQQGLTGQALGDALARERLQRLALFKKTQADPSQVLR